jgi:hypothetical protein
MMDTFTPLGVGSEYSWIRSGWLAGHLRVMANCDWSVIFRPDEFLGMACEHAGTPQGNQYNRVGNFLPDTGQGRQII